MPLLSQLSRVLASSAIQSLYHDCSLNFIFLLVFSSLVICLVTGVLLCHTQNEHEQIPLANGAWSYPSRLRERRQFVKSSKEILSKARKRYGQKPFRLLTDWGELVILPPQFADEIRNDDRLSFSKAATADNHAGIPGFETIHLISKPDQPIQTVARRYLTQRLNVLINPLSEETSFAVKLNFGQSLDWKQVLMKPAISDVVARISSRIQLGEELCRNEDWLRITKTYTSTFYTATTKLRAFPWAIRFLVHWFQPECQELRLELQHARRIIQPLVDQRRRARQEALAAGEAPPYMDDSIDWADQQAAATGSDFDPVVFQLTLSLLSIHTTYDLLQQTMIELARTSHFIEDVRREIVQVLLADGWKKTSLAKMKLLDSAIKEAQRLKPGSMVTMRRYVEEDITLSNGLLLKRGTRLNIDNSRLIDAGVYPEPQVFNPYRFFEMREKAGAEHLAHLVATSSMHLGFGHGQHACPGRFFAANEIKVALCHLLIKYDWKLAPGSEIEPDTRGMISKSSPETTMLVRLRVNPELDLDHLGTS